HPANAPATPTTISTVNHNGPAPDVARLVITPATAPIRTVRTASRYARPTPRLRLISHSLPRTEVPPPSPANLANPDQLHRPMAPARVFPAAGPDLLVPGLSGAWSDAARGAERARRRAHQHSEPTGSEHRRAAPRTRVMPWSDGGPRSGASAEASNQRR